MVVKFTRRLFPKEHMRRFPGADEGSAFQTARIPACQDICAESEYPQEGAKSMGKLTPFLNVFFLGFKHHPRESVPLLHYNS